MVDDQKVYLYYLRQTLDLGVYNSPIPNIYRPGNKGDNVPSFSVFTCDDERIRWKDFALGESGDGLDLICVIERLYRSNGTKDLQAAKSFYNRRISPLEVKLQARKKPRKNKVKDFTVFKRDNFLESELSYWLQYGLTSKDLNREFIYGSDGLMINDKLYYESTSANPTFIYTYSPDDDTNVKIYQPLNKKTKWRNWFSKTPPISSTYYTTLPDKGDHLVLCSSRKDMMVLKKLGYTCDSLVGETSKLITKYHHEYVKRFSKVYICLDGDAAGIKATKTLNEKCPKWIPLYLDYPEDTKDLADVVSVYDYETLRSIVKIK